MFTNMILSDLFWNKTSLNIYLHHSENDIEKKAGRCQHLWSLNVPLMKGIKLYLNIYSKNQTECHHYLGQYYSNKLVEILV